MLQGTRLKGIRPLFYDLYLETGVTGYERIYSLSSVRPGNRAKAQSSRVENNTRNQKRSKKRDLEGVSFLGHSPLFLYTKFYQEEKTNANIKSYRQNVLTKTCKDVFGRKRKRSSSLNDLAYMAVLCLSMTRSPKTHDLL